VCGFGGETERKMPLEKRTRRWDDNIKNDFEDMGFIWRWRAVVSTVMNLYKLR
jgi:hypothetical protein